MQIGTRIKTLLTELGIPQCRLAYDLNLAPNTVNGYIKNRRLPDCQTLSQIARYLGTNVDYLLGNTDVRVYPHLPLNEKETHILNLYRSMSPEQQHIFEELSAALYEHGCTRSPATPPSV